nr:MAG TPA: hypothetical protein [Caudoviricetes sp.]
MLDGAVGEVEFGDHGLNEIMNLNGNANLHISRFFKIMVNLAIKPFAKKVLNAFGVEGVDVIVERGFLLQGVGIGNGHAVVEGLDLPICGLRVNNFLFHDALCC